MSRPVISATGLYTPPHSISNAELVASLNAWIGNWNAEHAADDRGGRRRRQNSPPRSNSSRRRPASSRAMSSTRQACSILRVMRPHIAERPNDQISILAEIAVSAAKEALARGRQGRAAGHRCRDLRRLEHAARLSGDGG